ncbi:hypothetical protein M4I21_18210 [Cellulophaga sp. 20_2_10]|uniref:hypothetical protein n=1 Tax=Cellulophaga sp. 20_2_10 TaxID=2942476 RepID=UPI00201A3847|nr:hypothetical protein [Cellulophaga sp. 20_2_10]MCL5247748.1 hypothetical protein [Cellulophaga sp. 20_2_10]
MKKTLSIIILLLFFSCSNRSDKIINFGKFKITVPESWTKYDRKGIDSFVGGIITDTKDTLNFDYGRYSGDASRDLPMVYDKESLAELSEKERELLPHTKHLIVDDIFESNVDPKEYLKYDTEFDTIACYKTKIIKPKNKGFGVTGIYIDSLFGSKLEYNKVRFNFYGYYLSDKTQAEFIKALKTLSFENCNEK